MSTTKPIPLIILGMHRSGTSCLAGALQEAGVYLGDVSEKNPYNKKGNREHNLIMALNDDILSHNNGSWDSPPLKTIAWHEKHLKTGQEIICRFAQETDTNYWGFKDPRTLLTLPFWKEVLPNNTIFMGTFRHPGNVVRSLLNRKDHNLSEERGLNLWLSYNQNLIKAREEEKFTLLSFDTSPEEYQEKLDLITSQLNLPKSENNNFFDQNLISFKQKAPENNNIHLPQNISKLYERLQAEKF